MKEIPMKLQKVETMAPGGTTAPNAEWWGTLRAPTGTTPRKTPPTEAVQTKGREEPKEPKGPKWWKKIRSPLKSTATDTASERERETLRAPEKVIDRDRQIELTASFQKDWIRKQRKEQKYEATFPLELKKYAKNNVELQYLKKLQTKAMENYEPPKPKTHTTRQKKSSQSPGRQAVLLINQERATPREHMLCRGRVTNGIY